MCAVHAALGRMLKCKQQDDASESRSRKNMKKEFREESGGMRGVSSRIGHDGNAYKNVLEAAKINQI